MDASSLAHLSVSIIFWDLDRVINFTHYSWSILIIGIWHKRLSWLYKIDFMILMVTIILCVMTNKKGQKIMLLPFGLISWWRKGIHYIYVYIEWNVGHIQDMNRTILITNPSQESSFVNNVPLPFIINSFIHMDHILKQMQFNLQLWTIKRPKSNLFMVLNQTTTLIHWASVVSQR